MCISKRFFKLNEGITKYNWCRLNFKACNDQELLEPSPSRHGKACDDDAKDGSHQKVGNEEDEQAIEEDKIWGL